MIPQLKHGLGIGGWPASTQAQDAADSRGRCQDRAAGKDEPFASADQSLHFEISFRRETHRLDVLAEEKVAEAEAQIPAAGDDLTRLPVVQSRGALHIARTIERSAVGCYM